MKRLNILLFTVLLCFPGAIIIASAHEGATGVVKQRMDAMKVISREMKKLKALLGSGEAPNREDVNQAARIIRKHAVEMPELFPSGSHRHPSEASKRIWEDFEAFRLEADNLALRAGHLISPPEQEGTGAQKERGPDMKAFRALASACQSCHQSYRVKR